MSKKKQGRPKFTKQLLKGINKLTASQQQLKSVNSFNLFSLVRKGGKFQWVTLLGSDGLLISERKTARTADDPYASNTPLLVGVVIQSEQSTSRTKPNPLGKAAAAMTPMGIWIDLKKKSGGKNIVTRKRLDVVYVLLIVPKPTGAKLKSTILW